MDLKDWSTDLDPEKIGGEIHPLSITPVYMEMWFDEVKLASGTAFFVKSDKGPVLVTNRHNVTGRDQVTDSPLDKKTCAIPNHAKFQILGLHDPVWYGFELYRNDVPVWVEHSVHGSKVDVVGVLISELYKTIHRYADVKESWNKLRVANVVHVIGYPFGMNDNFATWSTGYIASEPDKGFNGLPAFLIDCRARSGQSGSLVIVSFKPGDIVSYKATLYSAKKEMIDYVGIYSGRINNKSDLGIVWKMEVIRDIVRKVESEAVYDSRCAYHRLKHK